MRVLDIPKYLKEKRREERLGVRVGRFGLRSEMREGRYWEKEEKRRCRICEWAEETWQHVMKVCMGEEEEAGREEILEILEEDGRWMKRLQKMRGRGRGEGRQGTNRW